MVTWKEKRDRNFQLELLELQLKHDHNIAIFSTAASISGSLTIFTMTFAIALLASGQPVDRIPLVWTLYVILSMISSIFVLVFSLIQFFRLRSSSKRELMKMKRQILNW